MSASRVRRDRMPPIGGEVSHARRIVLPANGPNSRKTVVSRTNAIPSGMSMPFCASCWPPVSEDWYWVE
jgi:hypothetical protein